jgi:putative ABC transport system permease protein
MRTPLAWLNLMNEKSRLVVAIAGVSFAVVLIFMNLGFLGALARTASEIYASFDAEVFLVSPLTLEISTSEPFPIERLYQAESVPGVERAMPLYVGYQQWRNPQTGISRAIFVYGINPNDPAFLLPDLRQPHALEALQQPDTVLMDRRSRPEFGPQQLGLETEASQRRVEVGGFYTLGGGFAADGTLITSDVNFARYFEPRPLSSVDLGMLKLQSGADPLRVRDELRQRLPQDVEVYTREEITNRDRAYWIGTTSTGFIFSLGVVVSLTVGAVIVYQILYTDIADHMKEYATLKAMGYSSRYLFGVVIQEAAILAVLGYLPGFVLALGLYELTLKGTGGSLPVSMDAERAVFVLTLAIAMCTISGLISVQKVVSADPAEVF